MGVDWNILVVAVTSAVSVASPEELVSVEVVAAAKEVVAVSMHPW